MGCKWWILLVSVANVMFRSGKGRGCAAKRKSATMMMACERVKGMEASVRRRIYIILGCFSKARRSKKCSAAATAGIQQVHYS